MQNVGLDEAQAGIKIAGRNISNLRYVDDTIFMAERQEELKSLLMKVKEESEKAGSNLNILKTKIIASGPITSWQWIGKQWKQWQTLFSWAPKSLQMVTVRIELKDTYSLEEKLWQICKVFWKVDTLLCWERSVQPKLYFFPVVMYGYESWTIKRAVNWRIHAFKLCCWRKVLRVPWTAKRSNQSILKDINVEYSLERLMLKLRLWESLAVLGFDSKCEFAPATIFLGLLLLPLDVGYLLHPGYLGTWCKELTVWERPWCWDRLKVAGEGNVRRQDG